MIDKVDILKILDLIQKEDPDATIDRLTGEKMIYKFEGILWLGKEILKENPHPESNAHANPKSRAYERLKWYPSVSIEQAKEVLKEEEELQKNPENYPGFKWIS